MFNDDTMMTEGNRGESGKDHLFSSNNRTEVVSATLWFIIVCPQKVELSIKQL